MQIIKTKEDIAGLQDNQIIGAEGLELQNSDIRFNGKGNILFLENKVKLVNSNLKFFGDNCVIYLGESTCNYTLDVTVYRDSVFCMGRNNYINGTLHAVVSERKNIFIGSGNLLSFGIWLRTADPHLIYSGDTHRRINPSSSVFIGDHVWLGQAAMVLKGSQLHSGCILGAMALLSGKSLPSNTSWGGNPARLLGENIFWERSCVHNWDEAETAAHETYKSDCFMYKEDAETLPFSVVDSGLETLKTADEKLEMLKIISAVESKNRFALNYRAADIKKTKHGLFRS